MFICLFIAVTVATAAEVPTGIPLSSRATEEVPLQQASREVPRSPPIMVDDDDEDDEIMAPIRVENEAFQKSGEEILRRQQ